MVSGNTAVVRSLNDSRLGVLLRPGNGNKPTDKPWVVDNGAFKEFKAVPFMRLLERVRGIPGCLWVAAPDVVCNHAATLALFEEWEPRLRAMGFPVAFVAQNGFRADEVPWDRIACLFIGGDDDFKLGYDGERATQEAKRRGKLVHMGRVNSVKRLSIAHNFGCDSADGLTFTMYPIELRKALKALPEVDGQALIWSRIK